MKHKSLHNSFISFIIRSSGCYMIITHPNMGKSRAYLFVAAFQSTVHASSSWFAHHRLHIQFLRQSCNKDRNLTQWTSRLSRGCFRRQLLVVNGNWTLIKIRLGSFCLCCRWRESPCTSGCGLCVWFVVVGWFGWVAWCVRSRGWVVLWFGN